MQLKAIKDWKFVFGLSLLCLYFLFFSTLYLEEKRPPSENWSRGLQIAEISEENIAYSMHSQTVVTLPVPKDDTFMTLWHEGTSIKYAQFTKEGKRLFDRKVDLNITKPLDLEARIEGDTVHLFSLEDKNLNVYAFSWQTGEVLYKGTVDKEVKGMTYVEDLLFYYGDKGIQTLGTSNERNTIAQGQIEKFEAVKESDKEIYHVAYVEKTKNGTKELKYATYDLQDEQWESHKMSELADTNYVGLSHIEIGMAKKDIYIITTLTDSRFGESTVDCYQFPEETPQKSSIYTLGFQGYAPNPKIIKNNREQLDFIVTEEIKTGRNTKTDELIEYTVEDGKIQKKRVMTKTGNLSIQPLFFTLEGENYLQWVDIKGKQKFIYIASDNQNIIKLAKNVGAANWMKLCMDTIFGLVPIFYIGIIPFVYMVLPVVLILFMAAVFFLSKMEGEPKKTLAVAIGLHMLAKLSFTRSTMMNNKDFFDMLPIFLKNPIIFGMLIIATSMVSIYCAIGYVRKKGRLHFFSSYMVFAVIDVIIYGLLVLPYYYTFIVLSYFTHTS